MKKGYYKVTTEDVMEVLSRLTTFENIAKQSALDAIVGGSSSKENNEISAKIYHAKFEVIKEILKALKLPEGKHEMDWTKNFVEE